MLSSLIMTLILSFCSLAYQFLIAKTLTSITHQEVTSYSLTAAVFLLFMGLGSFVESRRPATNPTLRLIGVELGLSFLGLLIVPWIFAMSIGFELIELPMSLQLREPLVIIGLGQVFSAMVGFLTGFEIPLLLHHSPTRSNKESLVLSVNYFGSLVASVVFPLLLVRHVGPVATAGLLASLNLGIVLWLSGRYLTYKKAVLWQLAAVFFLSGAIFFGSHQRTLTQGYLKIWYSGLFPAEWSWSAFGQYRRVLDDIPSVTRIQSLYQAIDIVPFGIFYESRNDAGFTLFLNQELQLSSRSQHIYHESMVEVPLALQPAPAHSILVLGGGDGLVAHHLLQHPEVKKITLVELDSEMLKLARFYPPLAGMNHLALHNPKVTIVKNDALSFIRESQETYDAIFMDFPFPLSYELLKLYSREFYTLAKRLLGPHGYFVIDFPVEQFPPEEQSTGVSSINNVLFNTLTASGFSHFLWYGLHASFLIASQQKWNFDEAKIFPHLSNATLMNVMNIAPTVGRLENNDKWVNSIFKPVPLSVFQSPTALRAISY